jgi:DNA polymerase-3 subunit delta
MQVRSDQLPQQLARGLKPLYVIHGDEPCWPRRPVTRCARPPAAGYSEREVFTVSGAHFDWSGCWARPSPWACSRPEADRDPHPPASRARTARAALQQYCDLLPEGVLTLVHLPRLDRQQLQGAWFQALDRAGVTVRVDPVERHQLPAWIAQRLAAQGQRVPARGRPAALAFFADRVEGNLLAAHQELQKLALLYPAGELGFEQIEEAVLDVARFDVFKLGTAVLAGQAGRALRMLDGLKAEGEAAVLVHWTLADDIRALARARAAMADGKPLPMALREARVWGEKERLFERVLPGLDDARPRRWWKPPASATAWSRACATPLAGRRLGRPAPPGADDAGRGGHAAAPRPAGAGPLTLPA